jgi:hypothetical protein
MKIKDLLELIKSLMLQLEILEKKKGWVNKEIIRLRKEMKKVKAIIENEIKFKKTAKSGD